MSNEHRLGFSKKIRFVYTLFFVIGIVLFIGCIRWQILNASEFKEISQGRIYTSELNALRGSVYASDGSTLAYSERTFDVNIWMGDLIFAEDQGIQSRDEFISKVAPIIDKTPEELEDIINTNYEDNGIKWFTIAKSITSEKWTDLQNLKTDKNENRLLIGYRFEPTSQRIYPEGRLASHVLGLTNTEKGITYGAGGLEGKWDGDLKPRKGIVIQESDAVGQAIASSLIPTIEPQPGSSLYTSIDKKLQGIVEEKLKEGVERFESKSGSIIIMDPKNGDILALASYPDYNPNLREEENQEVYTNRAISIPYEIGSVGKIYTLAAALDLGIIEPDTVILPDGHEGCEKFSDDLEPLCTWNKKPVGPLKAWECLVLSDNICFYHISELMKEEDFYEYLRGFGVGLSTGIDLAGEDPGLLKEAENWNLGDVAAFSYGHGYLSNLVNAVSAASVIPNKGIRIQPRVVNKIVKGDGEVIDFQQEALNNRDYVVSPETAETMGEILYEAYKNDIKDYEYWYHDLRNYKIGMKSGTALIANQYGYTEEINATQIGFDLSPDRKFIMIVKLEEPQVGDLSFFNSRVLWLDTFAVVKDHLQVPRIQ